MDMYFYLSLFILSFGNALAWYMIVHIFGLDSYSAKLIVGAIVAILGISTFFSFIVIHKRDNWLVRTYYTITASWMGILLNFGLTLFALTVIFWILKIFSINIPDNLFRSLLLFGTITYSIKSFYNAYKIHVRQETVIINNLPAPWEGKRIVHISDIHLGPILREDFFDRVINRIKEIKPDAVFITGDLFDGSEADFSWVNKPLNDLDAPLGLYYSLGNHDFLLGADKVISLLYGENITVLSNRMVEKYGLQIIGLDFTPDRNFDLKREILSHTGYTATKPSILLFHEPKETVKSEGVGIDLQLSGHTHGGQMFPFNFLARYFYHGHSHGLFRRHDYTLSVSCGVGTWGPPMRTGTDSEIVLITLRKK
jgi:predicted MPP superfamily phosphohydrolase